MIKAIDTIYQSYKFRSRLEARWAVFMDALDVRWEYEPEGYDLDGLYYLPDFWLPKQKMFIEIKPLSVLDDNGWPAGDVIEKLGLLSDMTKSHCVAICGTPGPINMWKDRNSYEGFIFGDCSYYWCECHICGSIGLQFECRAGRNQHEEWCPSNDILCDKNYNWDSQRILEAYAKARQARFEHKGSQPR